MNLPYLSDSHAHLDDSRYDTDRDDVIREAEEAGVGFILNPAVNEQSALCAMELTKEFDILYAAVGFHPSDCRDFDLDVHIPMMETWCQDEKVLAVGEIGLDYYYDDGAPRDLQKKVFEAQIDLANRMELPIVVHNRDAHQDSFEMVRDLLDEELSGVFHAYSGSVEMAKQLLDLGLYISIGGPLTFKNARKAPDVVAYVPLDRLLLETDSPYLTPMPYRGKRNHPAYVHYVAEKIAEIKNLSYEDVLYQTFENCKMLFGLDV